MLNYFLYFHTLASYLFVHTYFSYTYYSYTIFLYLLYLLFFILIFPYLLYLFFNTTTYTLMPWFWLSGLAVDHVLRYFPSQPQRGRPSLPARFAFGSFQLVPGCSGSFWLVQFVVFKPPGYCFEETIIFDVKASFISRPMSRLIR